MIERTAASQPSGLHLTFSSSSSPMSLTNLRTTSRRNLHSAFWNHSTANLELSNVWQVIVGLNAALAPNKADSSDTKNARERPGRVGPLDPILDFLYPVGIFSATPPARLNPSLDRQPLVPRIDSRPYASSSAASSTSSSFSPSARARALDAPRSSPANHRPLRLAAQKSPWQDVNKKRLVDRSWREDGTPTAQLRRMLKLGHTTKDFEAFDVLPDLWDQCPEDVQDELRAATLKFAAASQRTDRLYNRFITSLWVDLPKGEWDMIVVAAAIRAQFNTVDDKRKAATQAMHVFETGLGHNILGGLGMLTTHLFQQERWHDLLTIYINATDTMSRRNTGIARQALTIPPTPQSVESLISLARYAKKDPRAGSAKGAFNALLGSLAGHFADACSAEVLLPLVDHVPSVKAFCKVLVWCLETGDDANAVKLYRVYRQMDVQVNSDILEDMFEIYHKNNDIGGLEEILADWRRFHNRLSIRAYERFLGFYALRGNLKQVHSLWVEFFDHQRYWVQVTGGQGGWGKFRSNTFVFLLTVYLQRGEMNQVRRVFVEMRRKWGLLPNQRCWMIVLETYRRTNDYAGAINIFSKILRIFAHPNSRVMRIIASMAGMRGDLEFILWLVNKQKEMDGAIDINIMSGLVEALCQNEQFRDAEETAIAATREARSNPAPVWNVLIEHSARRHDLTNLSRLLGIMAEHKIKYTADTYVWLLRGLAYCHQTHHAYHLLLAALKDDSNIINVEHYLIVLSAGVGTHDYELCRKIIDLVKSEQTPTSTREIMSEVSALGTWQKHRRDKKRGLNYRHFISNALNTFHRCIQRLEATPSLSKSELVKPEDIEKIVAFSVLMKDFSSARDVIAAFRKAYPQDRYSDRYTHQLYNALLMAYTGDRNFEAVDETWDELFTKMKARASTKAVFSQGKGKNEQKTLVGKDKPSLRLISDFQRPILSIMRSCLMRDDPRRLQEVVKEIREAGFELSNRNWNFYVQLLARLRMYKEAFFLCEKLLMPGWRGWHDRKRSGAPLIRLALSVRQMQHSSLYLNPSRHTMLTLSKGLFDLEAAASWSTSKARLQREVREGSPVVLRAIKSLGRLLFHERKILRNPRFYGQDVVRMVEEQRLRELEEKEQREKEKDMSEAELAEVAKAEVELAARAQAEEKTVSGEEMPWVNPVDDGSQLDAFEKMAALAGGAHDGKKTKKKGRKLEEKDLDPSTASWGLNQGSAEPPSTSSPHISAAPPDSITGTVQEAQVTASIRSVVPPSHIDLVIKEDVEDDLEDLEDLRRVSEVAAAARTSEDEKELDGLMGTPSSWNEINTTLREQYERTGVVNSGDSDNDYPIGEEMGGKGLTPMQDAGSVSESGQWEDVYLSAAYTEKDRREEEMTSVGREVREGKREKKSDWVDSGDVVMRRGKWKTQGRKVVERGKGKGGKGKGPLQGKYMEQAREKGWRGERWKEKGQGNGGSSSKRES